VSVDDAEPFETRALRGNTLRGERHHAAIPLCLVLGVVEVEIIERSARDRARLRRARVHALKDASLAAKRPEPGAFFELDGYRVPYIGKSALIANKKAAGRHEDLSDVEELERLKES
jgi:hypothetical protein